MKIERRITGFEVTTAQNDSGFVVGAVPVYEYVIVKEFKINKAVNKYRIIIFSFLLTSLYSYVNGSQWEKGVLHMFVMVFFCALTSAYFDIVLPKLPEQKITK